MTDESLFLEDGSTTFHGRDRIAPVAAAIATGTPIEKLGPRVDDRMPLDYTPGGSPHRSVRRLRHQSRSAHYALRGRRQGSTDRRCPHDLQRRRPLLIIGSTGCIEISVAGGSAASLLQLGAAIAHDRPK